MAGEVSGKDLPRLRVVRLDRLNDDARFNSKAAERKAGDATTQQKATEQAVNITLSANAASRSAVGKVAQLAGNPLQKEISAAMEQASRNRKEDVDSLAKKVASDVRDDPDSALDAIGLTGSSVEVLKGTTRA